MSLYIYAFVYFVIGIIITAFVVEDDIRTYGDLAWAGTAWLCAGWCLWGVILILLVPFGFGYGIFTLVKSLRGARGLGKEDK